MKKLSAVLFLSLLLLTGCAVSDGYDAYSNGTLSEKSSSVPEEENPETFHFVDAYGDSYFALLDPSVEPYDYDSDLFQRDGDFLSYVGDPRFTSRLGVDVSYHQGAVDWTAVHEAGISFALIRIGYRGYGEEGSLNRDERFTENLEGARDAGLDVGIYFFAQAVDEEEAAEEARFVLEILNGTPLDLPVVYDPEYILNDTARTDSVSGEQFTRNTLAFCQTIEEAGYRAMFYSNLYWEAFQFDLSELEDYPIWYADYEPLPQTPYHFTFWQYSSSGSLPGIEGAVDLNLELIPAD